jgi:hypothetical protein
MLLVKDAEYNSARVEENTLKKPRLILLYGSAVNLVNLSGKVPGVKDVQAGILNALL